MPVGSRPIALALGGMLALASALGVGRFVYTPILPAMVEGLELSKAQAGLIASANFVGYLIGALLAAAPRLPGSRRAWLLGSLALGAATTGAMGLVSSLPAFLVLRGIGGAASAFVLVFASALVLDRLAGSDGPVCRRCTSPAWASASRSRPCSYRRCWPRRRLAHSLARLRRGLARRRGGRDLVNPPEEPRGPRRPSPGAPGGTRRALGRPSLCSADELLGDSLRPVRIRLRRHRDVPSRHRARWPRDSLRRAVRLVGRGRHGGAHGGGLGPARGPMARRARIRGSLLARGRRRGGERTVADRGGRTAGLDAPGGDHDGHHGLGLTGGRRLAGGTRAVRLPY